MSAGPTSPCISSAAGRSEEAGTNGPSGFQPQVKMHLVGSLQVGNSPHRNVIQKNLFLREFSAKNRKVRLKVTTEVPWKNRTKEVPMASNSSNAGVKENNTQTTQFAREIVPVLTPPRLLKLSFKPRSCEMPTNKPHIPHRKHHDLSSSPCADPPLHQVEAWQEGVDVLSAV